MCLLFLLVMTKYANHDAGKFWERGRRQVKQTSVISPLISEKKFFHYSWYLKITGKRTFWKSLDPIFGEYLERQFCDPSITNVLVTFQDKKVDVSFTNKGEVHVNTPSIELMREGKSFISDQSWKWYYAEIQTEDSSELKQMQRSPGHFYGLFPTILTRLRKSLLYWPCVKHVPILSSKGEVFDSKKIEQAYAKDPESQILYTDDNGEEFILDFRNFKRRHLRTGTTNELVRRPSTFWPSKLPMKAAYVNEIPRDWRNDKTLADFPGTLLSESDPNFIDIERHVCKYADLREKVSVTRVENVDLWKDYQDKRALMVRKLGENNLNEVLLFHGTAVGKTVGIVLNNLDPKYCREVASLGSGVYFCSDLSGALSFSPVSRSADMLQIERCFFICLVLMGESTLGSPSMKRLPMKPDRRGFFDSLVDVYDTPEGKGPRYAAIFDKSQIYPLFMVRLTEDVDPMTVNSRSTEFGEGLSSSCRKFRQESCGDCQLTGSGNILSRVTDKKSRRRDIFKDEKLLDTFMRDYWIWTLRHVLNIDDDDITSDKPACSNRGQKKAWVMPRQRRRECTEEINWSTDLKYPEKSEKFES